MKIGIILNPYGHKNPAGLSRFISNLTHELISIAPEHIFTLFIRGNIEAQEFKRYPNVVIHYLPDTIFWKDIAYIKNRDVDVWLYNNLAMPFFFTPAKSVTIALDFSNLYEYDEKKKTSKLSAVLLKFSQRAALHKATKVVCISESTKRDITKFFPRVPIDKVLVSMCGFTPPSTLATLLPMKELPESFYLLIGVIKPRKNQITAVKAFIEAKNRGLSDHLIITGQGKGLYYEALMKIIHNSAHREHIHYLGYRSDEEMATLFRRTQALIIPSKIEGFGMPVVEAMSCGTPVIISSHASLMEVAGGSAVIAETDSVESFVDALFTMTDETVRIECIRKGLERAKLFSWNKTAIEYMAIITELYHNYTKKV